MAFARSHEGEVGAALVKEAVVPCGRLVDVALKQEVGGNVCTTIERNRAIEGGDQLTTVGMPACAENQKAAGILCNMSALARRRLAHNRPSRLDGRALSAPACRIAASAWRVYAHPAHHHSMAKSWPTSSMCREPWALGALIGRAKWPATRPAVPAKLDDVIGSVATCR